jgi:hypothetical protein
MMLLKIVCQQCGHIGIVSAESLPRDFWCWQCGSSRRVEAEHGARIKNPVAFAESLFGEHKAPRAQSR